MRHRRAALLGAVGLTMTLIAGCGSVGGGAGGSSNAPAGGTTQDPKDMTMVNVVKVKGIAWFDRMAVGDDELRRSAPASTPARRARTTPARRSRSRSSRT